MSELIMSTPPYFFVWFKCPCGSDYELGIHSDEKTGTQCPICGGVTYRAGKLFVTINVKEGHDQA